ncbi:MAG: bifunctional folylpolyglutamate synthase/dihydrofolate synthase [Bacteroidales bacterium]|jgi:dihydrofolate synthase/folylpolyglutamate synthase|nr:bifunctional folylpolyglutamate synthase/dihydrofolate synthase [Bacteroidales bacterium]
MNYKQTIDYIFDLLPMYQRIGKAAYKSDLTNTLLLMEALDSPEVRYKNIHVGGTNGKGSTSHLLASILKEAGLKVGLFTSPHLKDFRERIMVEGRMVGKRWVTAFVKKNKQLIEEIKPSFFELTAAMAFKYFAEQKVDFAVIEVGMGGRLDSTNVIISYTSIITNISYDHTQFLGNTLYDIAKEKAGIIKTRSPIVIGETQEETKEVFIDKAKEKGNRIYFADKEFSITNDRIIDDKLHVDVFKGDSMYIKDLICPLIGKYQLKNIPTVLCAIEQLDGGMFHITKKDIKNGFFFVQKNAPFMGRWQKISDNPKTILDIGHNEAGIRCVVEQLKTTPYEQLHFVLGVVNDKDVDAMLKILPKDAKYYLCKANIPRGMDVETLSKKAKKANLSFEKYSSVKQALKKAQKNAKENDLVFVGGSAFVVAECL